MSSVTDMWRAVDPDARLLGDAEGLGRPVRSVTRTRSAAPHLPPAADGALLVADAGLLERGAIGPLLAAIHAAELRPAAVVIGGHGGPAVEPESAVFPVLVSAKPVTELVGRATAYLTDEGAVLRALASELRLACAEAALADPQPASAAGLVSARLGRGVAVVVDGQLVSLHARPAGRAIAARFVAIHQRLHAVSGEVARDEVVHRRLDGLWLLEGRVRPGASVWLFDDRPLAAVDEVAARSLSITMRALLRRPVSHATPASRGSEADASPPAGLATGGAGSALEATLLAVARANGRIAPAARALGVHRNTVLNRLHQARRDLGVDPRRPEDALRIIERAVRREPAVRSAGDRESRARTGGR